MLCSCLVINDRNVTVLVHMCLQVLGNHTEFQRVASLLQDTVDFDIDVNASVFETNIRGARGGCGMFLAQPRPSVCVCVVVNRHSVHVCLQWWGVCCLLTCWLAGPAWSWSLAGRVQGRCSGWRKTQPGSSSPV